MITANFPYRNVRFPGEVSFFFHVSDFAGRVSKQQNLVELETASFLWHTVKI